MYLYFQENIADGKKVLVGLRELDLPQEDINADNRNTVVAANAIINELLEQFK